MRTDICLFTTTPEGRFLSANETTARKLGYETPAQLIESVTDIGSKLYADPGDREEIIRILLEEGEVRNFECPMLRSDGTEFWACISVLAVKDSSGVVSYLQGAAEDVTELRQIERASELARKRMETVLNGINAVIYVADMETYEVLFINDKAREVFGEVKGKKCWKSVQSSQKGPCDFCTNGKLVDNEGNPTGIHRWEFQNTDNRRWYDCHDCAVKWTDGRMVRLETAIDITERKQAEQRLHLNNDQLQKTLAEQDMFFAILAHDLKSPMSGLLTLSALLDKDIDILSEEDLRYVTRELHKSAKGVFELLQDLLQWSRIRRDGLEFVSEVCQLDELVQMSLDSTRLVAERKNIDIHNLVPEKLRVNVDMAMINTVLRNVFFNAIKFTHKGGKISVSGRDKGWFVEVCVQDNGIGMDEENLSRVFAIGKKTRQQGTEGEGGTGLGLILCKELIHKHGGSIWVESEPGQGTQVCFSLPAADS